MNERPRIPRQNAEAVAVLLIEKLAPFCERIEIAGSIRRKMNTVKDIEIVAIPRTETPQLGLFGDPGEPISLLKQKLDSLVLDGFLEKRTDDDGKQRWGEKHQRALFQAPSGPIGIDFFAVLPPAQWGVIFAIRTGNYEFSRNLVTGTFHGGRMPDGLRVSDGALWRVAEDRETKLGVVHTPEEKDFFEAIGWPDYPAPEARYFEDTKGTRP
jgi:DNA polymerase/3'-5' exonuclease PolX